MQQSVFHRRADDIDPVAQHEAALELTTGDTAIKEDPFAALFRLPATNDQLTVFDRDRKIFLGKARDSECDAERTLTGLFNVIRRVAVVSGLGRSFDEAFELFESHMEGLPA